MIPLFLFLIAPADPALAPAAREAAFAACARLRNGIDDSQTATAVCVGNRDGFAYLLTAAHAIPKGDARAYEFFAKESDPKPTRTLTRAEIVFRLAGPDLALVKIPTQGTPIPAIKLAPTGERPLRFPFDAVSIGCPNGVRPRDRSERIVAKALVRRDREDVAFYWQTAVVPVGGMSGGPLLDASGRVIGVCVAGQGGKGYFSHADEILYALKENGHAWLFE